MISYRVILISRYFNPESICFMVNSIFIHSNPIWMTCLFFITDLLWCFWWLQDIINPSTDYKFHRQSFVMNNCFLRFLGKPSPLWVESAQGQDLISIKRSQEFVENYEIIQITSYKRILFSLENSTMQLNWKTTNSQKVLIVFSCVCFMWF